MHKGDASEGGEGQDIINQQLALSDVTATLQNLL